MDRIETFSDQELIKKLLAADRKETSLMTEILLSLAELDRRKLYLEAGYSSLFAYCTEKLKYSESAAYKRISSARLISSFPEALKCFKEKKINLTTLSMVSRLITSENCKEILNSISGKSKRDLEVFIAQYRTDNMLKSRPKEQVKVIATTTTPKRAALATRSSNSSNQHELFAPEEAEEKAYPKKELRYELKLSVDEKTFQAIEQVKSLLSGKYPKGASLEEVMIEATSIFLDKNDPKRKEERRTRKVRKSQDPKSDQTETCATKGGDPDSLKRYISPVVRDRVYLRDQRRCSYVSSDGTRCSCRHNLQIDHIVPYARGGSNNPDNLRLLCQAHNLFEAEKHFGPDYIELKIREAG